MKIVSRGILIASMKGIFKYCKKKSLFDFLKTKLLFLLFFNKLFDCHMLYQIENTLPCTTYDLIEYRLNNRKIIMNYICSTINENININLLNNFIKTLTTIFSLKIQNYHTGKEIRIMFKSGRNCICTF